MTREEIEKKMDELARKYVETPRPGQFIDELYELATRAREDGETRALNLWGSFNLDIVDSCFRSSLITSATVLTLAEA
jgi:hypothetical protein